MFFPKKTIEDKIAFLRTLAKWKDADQEDVYKRAIELLEKDVLADTVLADLPAKREKDEARKRLLRYLEEYKIDSMADRDNLASLVYLEIIHMRYQNELNSLHKEKKSNPIRLTDAIHKNLDKIRDLKEQLGMTADKDTGRNPYEDIETLKRKVAKWRKENPGRYRDCPHCGKGIWMIPYYDKWDLRKHPFYADRFLLNKHLIEMYEAGKISKIDVAKVLEVSEFYVDWLLKTKRKYFEKESTSSS